MFFRGTGSERFSRQRRRTVGGDTVSSGLLDGSPNSGGAVACVRHGRPDFTEAASADRRRDASPVLFLGIPPRVAGSRAARGAHESLKRGPRLRRKSTGPGVPVHVSPARTWRMRAGNIDWCEHSRKNRNLLFYVINADRMFNSIFCLNFMINLI